MEYNQLLNKIRVGNVDEDVENKIKSRFIEKKKKKGFPHDVLHTFAENKFVNQYKKQFLQCFSGDTFKIDSIDVIPVNCDSTEFLIYTAQNQKLTNTDSLAKPLELKARSKVMLMVKIDIEDHVINCQIGHITFFESASNQVSKIFVKFDNKNGGKKGKCQVPQHSIMFTANRTI